MGIIRSYFSKNNTLIEGNETNNSQNPVTEISYGTLDKLKTRYIFDVNMDRLVDDVNRGLITQNNVVKHTLKMTNTISYAPKYIGKKSYSSFIDRASSFSLDLFNITQEWDEGSGYDFLYDDSLTKNPNIFPSNWNYSKHEDEWDGAYVSGSTEIINNQVFQKGNENVEIDVTNYINQRLGFTGNTAYSGDTFGLGLKFSDYLESTEALERKAVAFHAKNTNTWYEPYIETVIDNTIQDDRLYFYQDKENELYFYINHSDTDVVSVDSVKIYDYLGKQIDTISGDSIIYVKKGVYKIKYLVSSNNYPDAVLFKDSWNFTINEMEKNYIDNFYLINGDAYHNFNGNTINFDNYFFNFSGILQGEKLQAEGIRKIKLHIKEFYESQDNNKPLNVEYRIYTIVAKNHIIDVIPYSKVDRTRYGFEIALDTSWLIPQDYYLELRLSDGEYTKTKEGVKFTIVSNNIFK